MPIITLPNGEARHYQDAVAVDQVVRDIGSGLAKAAVAAKVNGKVVDLTYLIAHDVELVVLTENDAESLEVIRHSCAHLLAQAVKQLFPHVQVTIGPVIENGFYYDFANPTPFHEADLQRIEDRMVELAKQNQVVTCQVMSRDEAIAFFTAQGEHYKAEIIADIPADEPLTVYKQGDFVDLCRGPHVPNTSKLKAFKLMKLAGSYWRGNANNAMLQRIYGTAWLSKQALADYLTYLEEAEKRDHRKLAKSNGLFHTQEEAPGMIFWHPNGWQVYQAIEQYMRKIWSEHGYQEVHTPQLVDRSLWERSGHWDKFADDMFTIPGEEGQQMAIKPMSCPCHIQIFNQGLKSYRDLPLRLAEFGNCHRNEASGTLHGLMRTRNFTQDDAHIFCTEEQIQSEVSAFIDCLFSVYKDFGFEDVIIKLSTRPEKRVGSDLVWDKAEKALALALDSKGLAWQLFPGEGAFYGPKIEFSLRDCLGRVWQCGTMQIDFSMPERLGAQYVAEDSSKRTPVMLHRAICGSLERFIGVLIEHYAGRLPVWLAPLQVIVLNITDKHAEYAQKITCLLQKQGFRAKSDLRNEKIGFKIREHTLQHVPYQVIVGDKELTSQTVTVRNVVGEDLGSMSCDALSAKILSDIEQRCCVGGKTD